MQVEGSTFAPRATQGHVLCCLCGAKIVPNSSNMCAACLRTQVDITEGLQKQATVLWCKQCARYLQPPKHWLRAEPESKELLTFCLKKIKGLQKVKLVDAGFIWTEPHSRRLKVKVTVQAEVFAGTILQQSFVVEYVVETHMCPDCEKQNTNPNVWVAAVQVRQHVEHKRTFLYLEQLILKHNADAACTNVRNIHEGVDFFFGNRAHAQKFVDFLQSVVPVRYRQDKQLVSHNTHSNTYNYKYTYSVEIVPVCRDDLICFPAKLATAMGSTSPVTLCTRVTNVLSFIDPVSLRVFTLDAASYWRYSFRPLLPAKQLEAYIVLDVELTGVVNHKHGQADVQVAKLSDFGSNDRTYTARTHLGHLLHAGDHVLGYDLTTAQLADPELERYTRKGAALPDVVLVRKSYEEKRRRRRARGAQRAWKLKRLTAEQDEEPVTRGRARPGGDIDREAEDRERFMQELEEDPELRSRVALYRNAEWDGGAAPMTDGDEDGDSLPDVPLEELLDDLSAMQIADTEMGEAGGAGA